MYIPLKNKSSSVGLSAEFFHCLPNDERPKSQYTSFALERLNLTKMGEWEGGWFIIEEAWFRAFLLEVEYMLYIGRDGDELDECWFVSC